MDSSSSSIEALRVLFFLNNIWLGKCFTQTASDGVGLQILVMVSLILYRAERNEPCVYNQDNKLI